MPKTISIDDICDLLCELTQRLEWVEEQFLSGGIAYSPNRTVEFPPHRCPNCHPTPGGARAKNHLIHLIKDRRAAKFAADLAAKAQATAAANADDPALGPSTRATADKLAAVAAKAAADLAKTEALFAPPAPAPAPVTAPAV